MRKRVWSMTTHTQDGINDMVYNRCVGTRYCANNCPVEGPSVQPLRLPRAGCPQSEVAELVKMVKNPDVTVRSRGVIEKCTYCVQRITAGPRSRRLKDTRRRRPMNDGAVTACQHCPVGDDRCFGDITDQKSGFQAAPGARDYAV